MSDTVIAPAAAARYADLPAASGYSHLSISTLRRMLADGRLTAFRPVGGRVLLDLRELDRLIRQSAGARGTRGRHLHEDEGPEQSEGH